MVSKVDIHVLSLSLPLFLSYMWVIEEEEKGGELPDYVRFHDGS